jgi:hypothetical protein
VCASNVSSPDYRCTDSSWAQGGIGLYLCNTNGYQKFVNEGGVLYSSDITSRSALVVNINTNAAYPITTSTAVTVQNFRLAIMDNFAISEGDPDIWKGILLHPAARQRRSGFQQPQGPPDDCSDQRLSNQ